MKKVKGKDEENFKHPKNDVLILQFANTALGNRLDHQKRIISQLKLNESSYRAICEVYEFFFTSYFAGWKNFLGKLERLNLLVKKQDNNERQTSKFKQLFDSMGELVQIVNKLKECMEKTTKDAAQAQIPNNLANNNNSSSTPAQNASNTNAVSKQRAQTNAAALQDLQKITKQRVENFLKNFENIYADVAIDCATYGQRMNDAVKSLAQNNDANDTMRRLYRENSQLQTKIKELETFLSKPVPLADTEKEFIMNYFGNQSKQYEELLQKYNEEREISERLSLRIRQKMDYCVTSITAKVGQDPNQILQKIIQNNASSLVNSSSNNSSGKENQSQSNANQVGQQQQNQMEIEDQQQNNNANANNNASNNNGSQENKNEEREGYECICGGYQTEYFSQKYEETLKQLLETQQKLIATQTIINTSPSSVIPNAFSSSLASNTQNGNVSNTSNGVSGSQGLQLTQQESQQVNQNGVQSSQLMNTSGNDAINTNAFTAAEENKNNSQNLELNGQASLGISSMPSLKKQESIQVQQSLVMQPSLINQASTTIQDELCDGKLRLPIAEKLQILQKRNEQLVLEKSELEKYMREREIDLKNMEDKFFRSGAYQSLAAQTEELLKVTIQMRNQLKEAKQQISDIEKQRFREMQEVLTKFKEEKDTLQKQLHEAREGVYKTQLGDAMRENLTQHFNYKKYTQPLEDQLEKSSECLTIEREHNKELELKKQQLNEQIALLQKSNGDLSAKLNEKEQQINYLQSQIGFTGESYVEDKIFKYPVHKDTIKFLEKIMNDMCSSGQINQDQIKKFRELIDYVKNREDKISYLQKQLKQNEQEKKKQQANQDEIWKEYENLDKSFNQMKARCDQVNQELKLSQEREQGLEYKNLEIQMQFQKEKQSYSILVVADQQKKDNTKNLIDNLEDQNKQLLLQNSNLSNAIDEVNQQKQLIQSQLEENTVLLLDTQQKLDLLTKKFGDVTEQYNELIANHEKIQQKLQNAYEFLDNSESKNTSTEVASLKEKIQNMRLLLQCSCGQNFKDTILQKCMHPFCRECIDKQMRLRQRTCPKCRTPFGQNDIKTLYLSH